MKDGEVLEHGAQEHLRTKVNGTFSQMLAASHNEEIVFDWGSDANCMLSLTMRAFLSSAHHLNFQL